MQCELKRRKFLPLESQAEVATCCAIPAFQQLFFGHHFCCGSASGFSAEDLCAVFLHTLPSAVLAPEQSQPKAEHRTEELSHFMTPGLGWLGKVGNAGHEMLSSPQSSL